MPDFICKGTKNFGLISSYTLESSIFATVAPEVGGLICEVAGSEEVQEHSKTEKPTLKENENSYCWRKWRRRTGISPSA